MSELNVKLELRNEITEMVDEINKLIFAGVNEVYNEAAEALVEKYSLIKLLHAGCRHIKRPTTFYIELPSKEITSEKLESILFNLCK